MSENERPRRRVSVVAIVAVVASLGCLVLAALLVVVTVGATTQYRLAREAMQREMLARKDAEQARDEALRQREAGRGG
jgi:hypothetical protein